MANTPIRQLRNPPIVEAVLDVDCDLPPGFDIASLEEPARARFQDRYPKSRKQLLQEFKIETGADPLPKMSARPAIQAYRFLQDDERQLVQVRSQGFSLNRLAPYTTLDDYLPEIERAWGLYVNLVSPVQIRVIRLRYINRILVPMTAGQIDLDEFFKIGPRVPDEEKLMLSGFLEQQASIEKGTGYQVNLVLTAQSPAEQKLPVILDITVASTDVLEAADWASMLPILQSLRSLKNRIFANSLTSKCIELFQ
ncbi:MAG TPA: TIGR04255 family protein [Xanthobacteraceae bacterium]|jgi:uncharacterized protein (TIGR04255 family)